MGAGKSSLGPQEQPVKPLFHPKSLFLVDTDSRTKSRHLLELEEWTASWKHGLLLSSSSQHAFLLALGGLRSSCCVALRKAREFRTLQSSMPGGKARGGHLGWNKVGWVCSLKFLHFPSKHSHCSHPSWGITVRPVFSIPNHSGEPLDSGRPAMVSSSPNCITKVSQ